MQRIELTKRELNMLLGALDDEVERLVTIVERRSQDGDQIAQATIDQHRLANQLRIKIGKLLAAEEEKEQHQPG